MRNPHKTTSTRRILRPLVGAVHRHDAVAVKQLFEGSSAPDIGLALHTAYSCNDLTCLEILAPYAAVEHNSWVLICAASQGHIEAIRIVMPFADPTASDNLALKMALIANQWDCVDLLKNTCSAVKCTNALNNAIKLDDHENFEKIVACTAPIVTDQPLICAARFGRDQFVSKIITMSNLQDINSEALTVAAHYGYLKCVELLIGVSSPKDFPQVLANAFMGAYVELCLVRHLVEPLGYTNPYPKPEFDYICVFDVLYDPKILHDTHCILIQMRTEASHYYQERWNLCIEKFELWSAQCQRKNLIEHIGSSGISGSRKM